MTRYDQVDLRAVVAIGKNTIMGAVQWSSQ